MKRKILFIAFFGILNFIFIACAKNEKPIPKNGSVELYLIDSYKTVGNTCQIDETTVVTKDKPLVTNNDFLSYDSSKHIFEISETARETLKGMDYPVNGIAFAIKANNSLIYTGYFWPGYSSMGCAWVVIDPIMLSLGNNLKVELGYPGLVEGQVIPDKRNDKRIIDIFASQDKLLK